MYLGSDSAAQSWNLNQQLTFKWLGWYLNFSTWFVKNTLFAQEKCKIIKQWLLVENKTDYAACLKNAVIPIIA
jgi:hypothetical protein